MVKKEETNDILQFLYPQLRDVEISVEQCKQDVTIKGTGRQIMNEEVPEWILILEKLEREGRLEEFIESFNKNGKAQ